MSCHTVAGGAGGTGRCGGWGQDRSAAGTTWRQAGSLCPGCLQGRKKLQFTWLRGHFKTNSFELSVVLQNRDVFWGVLFLAFSVYSNWQNCRLVLPSVLARLWNSSVGTSGSGSSLKYSLRTPETTFTSALLSRVTASRRSERGRR